MLRLHACQPHDECACITVQLPSDHHACTCRYQGVDWRNSSYHGCNQRRNPSAPLGNDGLDLSPMEVMFVVVREQQVTADLKSEVPLALSKYKVGDRAGSARPPPSLYMHLVIRATKWCTCCCRVLLLLAADMD